MVLRFQHAAGHPSDKTISHSLITNGIKNSPISKRDVDLTIDVLGKRQFAVQGKTTRSQPSVADETMQKIVVPKTIKQCYDNAELAAEEMHLNDLPSVTSLSDTMNYGTIRAA